MSENDKDSIYNLLTNTSRSGNNFPSAIYLVGTTKTNDSPTDFTTAACFRNYNSVLARDDLLLCIFAITSRRTLLPQVAAVPVTHSPHRATVPHFPPLIRLDQTMCLRMTKIPFIIF